MNNPTVPDIANIITELRAYLNLSRVKFGEPLGLSPTQIMRFEKGIYVPSPEIIKKICEVFDVDERLFEDDSITIEDAIKKRNIDSEVSIRLKTIREEKGWSQTELAKRAGVTGHLIYRIEAGQRLKEEQGVRIAEALEVGVDWLMRGNEDRKNYQADQKMTDWLWEHPDVREKIWDMMKNEE